MRKVIVSIIVAIVLLAGVVGLLALINSDKVEAPQTTNTPTSTDTQTNNTNPGTDTPTNTTPASQSSNVEIKDSAYSPASITVKKGTTITWTNKDAMRHDISPDTETDAFKASELLDKDETYSFTFNTVGTYTYHCTPHPFMKGTVIVTE